MDRLGNYFADGYLDIDEFSERTEAAAIARNASQLERLFADLPSGTDATSSLTNSTAPSVSDASASTAVSRSDSEQELERLLRKGEKLKIFDGVAFAIGIATLGLLIFTDLDYVWAGFVLATAFAVGGRMVLDISDEEENILEELSESESKRRAERLRLAAEKRREIEQRGEH